MPSRAHHLYVVSLAAAKKVTSLKLTLFRRQSTLDLSDGSAMAEIKCNQIYAIVTIEYIWCNQTTPGMAP